MREMIRELIQYRELLWVLTWRNIKIKYKQTAMGFLWAIFMPAIIVLSGIIVKKAMAMFSGRPMELEQIVSVCVRSLPWAFFVGALKFSVGSLVSNMNLIKKIYFPREVFPLSYILSQLVDFAVAGTVLAIILSFMNVGLSIHLLWLPVIIIFLILFVAALGFLLSCANLFFRDVKYITDVVLTFGIFFTPIFYSAELFGRFKNLLLLNPIGAIVENISNVVVLQKAPDYLWMTYVAIMAVGGFFLSWRIFHKAEYLFAENV